MSQEKPWEGDHGFTGIALLAWERQRAAYRMVDAHIAWRTDKDPKVRGCYALLLAWARSCPCPQTLGPGGTSEGADWVSQKRPCPEKPDLTGANLTGGQPHRGQPRRVGARRGWIRKTQDRQGGLKDAPKATLGVGFGRLSLRAPGSPIRWPECKYRESWPSHP